MNTNTQIVEITLNGQTKVVTIERYTEQHVWHAVNAPVLCKFRTGTKLHREHRPQVTECGGKWFICQYQHPSHTSVRSRATVVGWDEGQEIAKW